MKNIKICLSSYVLRATVLATETFLPVDSAYVYKDHFLGINDDFVYQSYTIKCRFPRSDNGYEKQYSGAALHLRGVYGSRLS
jgi:hypothetical protein